MSRSLPSILSVLLLSFALPAHAVTIMINNGLAPPNPANVIDYLARNIDPIYVRNLGCPLGWPAALPDWPCASPGSATEAEINPGADAVYVSTYDSSSVTMNGGRVYYLNAYDSSSITTTGAEYSLLYYLYAYDASNITISGGGPEQLYAYDSSSITMSDGWLFQLYAYDASEVTVSGGRTYDLYAEMSSAVTMGGGYVEHQLYAYDSSTVTVSGGTVGDWLWAADSSLIEISGSDFAVDGVPVPYGDLSAVFGTLTGTLDSGDPIDNPFYQGGFDGGGDFLATGTIRLVPEPTTALLLAAGLFGLAWRSRLLGGRSCV